MKKIIMAASLCLGMATLANAQTSVYITGSTAMRGVVYNTLKSTAVFDAVPTVTTYGGSSASGSTYMAFAGTVGGASTVIQCHWSGSEAGILDLASNLTEAFIAPSFLNGLTNGTSLPGGFTTNAVDLALADNNQTVSRTPLPLLNSGSEVAVIPFTFVRNNGLWAGTNVTRTQIYQALGNNGITVTPRALFDGNTTNVNDFVYISGRDQLSGTRANALGVGVTGWGILNPVGQIEINSAGAMQSVGGSYLGDFGFSSGGTLAGTMGANTTSQLDQVTGATGFSVIAYLGRSDANTAIANGAVELTFNGVAETPANVINGTYDFWGNEYVYLNNTPSSSLASTVYSKLINTTTGLNNFCDDVLAIKLTDMHATRIDPNSIQQRQ